MTQFLPPNLLALFAPRDPIPYLPPPDKLPFEKKNTPYQGLAVFVKCFEDPKDTPPPTRVETREERQERKRREKAEMAAYRLEQEIAVWDPSNSLSATSDPYKTLFVARVNYDTSESKLRREFEVYGPIRKIGLTMDRSTNKPRGYAFIEYEHERDMHSAYKHADGKKIDGRRVLVDVERGRTVKGWLPRRLGGGLGGTRRGGPDVNSKHSGREDRFYDERAFERRPMRSRSRSRERRPVDRERRRSRSRSPRDRRRGGADRNERRRRSRERGMDDGMAEVSGVEGPDMEEREKRKRSRSRSRDRERRRHRSRSRERGRSRDRSRDRRRRDRDRRHRDDRQGDGLIPADMIKKEKLDPGYGDLIQYPAYDPNKIVKEEPDEKKPISLPSNGAAPPHPYAE